MWSAQSTGRTLIRLRGWKALAFLLGLAALVAVRYTREHELPAMARESILMQLKADYSRPVLANMRAVSHDRAALAQAAATLDQNQRVQIEKATTRGILWPKYVRVEVSVNGEPPPDGEPVRYFTIGWPGVATSNVSGIHYYCDFW